MSTYGLIKENSRIKRHLTINDLTVLNSFRQSVGLRPISSYGQSVRRLENSVALGLSDMDNCPELSRGTSFYKSLLNYKEMNDRDVALFNKVNQTELSPLRN